MNCQDWEECMKFENRAIVDVPGDLAGRIVLRPPSSTLTSTLITPRGLANSPASY